MTKFNAWNVIKNGLNGQSYWTRQWRDPEPKSSYDVVIIGGGLHGLATAYYLAKNHNIKNVAVQIAGNDPSRLALAARKAALVKNLASNYTGRLTF